MNAIGSGWWWVVGVFVVVVLILFLLLSQLLLFFRYFFMFFFSLSNPKKKCRIIWAEHRRLFQHLAIQHESELHRNNRKYSFFSPFIFVIVIKMCMCVCVCAVVVSPECLLLFSLSNSDPNKTVHFLPTLPKIFVARERNFSQMHRYIT